MFEKKLIKKNVAIVDEICGSGYKTEQIPLKLIRNDDRWVGVLYNVIGADGSMTEMELYSYASDVEVDVESFKED